MPTIEVANPGTSTTEFIQSAATPKVKFYTKTWFPSDVSPSSPPRAAVLFVHGFLENVERYDHVFPVFASKGIQVTAFDQRGFGKTAKEGTEGAWKSNHGNTSRHLQYQDIAFMITDQESRLEKQYGVAKVPLFLVGHSMGGGLVLASHTRPAVNSPFPPEVLSKVKGVVALAPWLKLTSPPMPGVVPIAGGLISIFPSARMKAPLSGEDVSRDRAVVKEYIESPYTNPWVQIRAIHGPLSSGLEILKKEYVNFPEDKPLLLVHGTADKVCDVEGSKQFHDKVKAKDKKIILLDGLYHEMHNEPSPDKENMINQVVNWILERVPAQKVVETTEAAAPVTAATAPVATETKAGDRPTKAWATLLTGSKYLPGLYVFSKSLLHGPNASKYPLVVMVTDDVDQQARQAIRDMGCVVRPIEEIRPTQKAETLAAERFSLVWTKLRAFELEEYNKVILIDSDMLVRKNMDELMDLSLDGTDSSKPGIAASFACSCNPRKVASYPDSWIPANCPFTPQTHPSSLTIPPIKITSSSPENHRLINSGLVVLQPQKAVMDEMIHQIQNDPEVPAMRFPDQDFLAKFYRDRVTPLPWIYNALKTLRACHTNLWRDEEVKNVHYILDKPWSVGRPKAGDDDEITSGWWWQAWDEAIQSKPGSLAPDEQFQKLVGQFVKA